MADQSSTLACLATQLLLFSRNRLKVFVLSLIFFKLLRGLRSSRYLLSLSWSRLFPLGNLNGNEDPNYEAVQHYNHVIDELIRRQITPEVTLYHFDLPQGLEDAQGSFMCTKNILDMTYMTNKTRFLI